MELTSALARFVSEVRYQNLPPTVVDQTKLLLLDLLGVAIRGRVGADSSGPLDRAFAELVPGPGPCTAVGHDRIYPAHYAALFNATYAHSLDFDDTHAAGSLHPGATVISAALATGEAADIAGKEFLAAIVAGYEVCCRLAEALPASSHYDRGFHPSATTGSFAAAVPPSWLLAAPLPILPTPGASRLVSRRVLSNSWITAPGISDSRWVLPPTMASSPQH